MARRYWPLVSCGLPGTRSGLAGVPIRAKVVLAVLTLFLDLARPEHIRMRHLLKELPVEAFMAQLAQRLPVPLIALSSWRREPGAASLHIGTYPQRDADRVYDAPLHRWGG